MRLEAKLEVTLDAIVRRVADVALLAALDGGEDGVAAFRLVGQAVDTGGQVAVVLPHRVQPVGELGGDALSGRYAEGTTVTPN